MHYAYGVFALIALLAPFLYAPTDPRTRLLWFGGRGPRRGRPRGPRVHDCLMTTRLRPQPRDPGAARARDHGAEPPDSLVTASILLQVAFFIAIAFVAYMLWRDFGRREIELWPRRAQWIFYGAVACSWSTSAGSSSCSLSGLDALAFFLVAAACGYAAFRTWRDAHRYSVSATPRRARRRRRGGRARRGRSSYWPTKIGVSRSV